jgi:hypothetical protein
MKESKCPFRLDQPATYQIEVQGRLEKNWVNWFDNMTITVTSNTGGPTSTILTGTVKDQAALHGLLARIRDLGLLLLRVQRIETGGQDDKRTKS